MGKDPEVRYLTNGTAVCSFSVACNADYKDKAGEIQKKTEWVNLTAFGKPAEIIAEYCHKGSKIYAEGSLTTRSYDKNGETRYITEIRVDNFQLLDQKQTQETSTRRPQQSKPSNIADEFNDDIPFN